jgi:hypothetical protein
VRLLGLTGFARSGKDTVARILGRQNSGVRRAAFADLLKLSAARSLHVLVDPDDVGMEGVRRWADRFKQGQLLQIVDESGEVIHSVSGRVFLQRFGTEGHRDIFGDDFWVEMANFEPPDCELLVFTDVRYTNEALAIRDRGGQIWRVVNDDASPAGRHRSEQPLDSTLIDREIPNNGSLKDLELAVASAHAEVFGAGAE